MTHWSAATSTNLWENWFVDPREVLFAGIRCTHMPSPWMGDYGQFLVSTTVDNLDSPRVALQKAVYKPHIFNATVVNQCSAAGCARVEFTPLDHGGIFKLVFPPGLGTMRKRLQITVPQAEGNITLQQNTFEGWSATHSGGVVNKSIFKHYLTGQVVWGEGVNRENIASEVTCGGKVCVADLSWTSQGDWDVVELGVGVSFISMAQAWTNLKREYLAQGSFVDVVAQSKASWTSILDRVQVFDKPTPQVAKNKVTFYTHLYRALLFPRDLSEIDEHGNRVHFSPYDAEGRVFSGALMTDSGFWDAYRTVYPLLHLLFPDLAQDVMKGWVNAIRENNGRLPQWPSPGPRDEMVGTMGDVTLAEALVNGQLDPVDSMVAYQAMLRNAYNSSGLNSRGPDLLPYTETGYIPGKVAETLNNMMADYAIAQASEVMDDPVNQELLLRRANRWNLLFDSESQFFRPKTASGDFVQPFDRFAWDARGAYTEGGAYQYRFYVPFDGSGLSAAYDLARGSAGGLCAALEETMHETPAFHLSSTFHEAVEMATQCWGQYAHNNQPSHHMLYMFAHGNCSKQGQLWIQHAVNTLYGEFGFSGDEDNGEMSSWHVLSSLGLYALAPGSGRYQVGAPPLFEHVKIRRPQGIRAGDLEIFRSPALELQPLDGLAEYPVASGVKWNKTLISLEDDSPPASLSFRELLRGGRLDFV